MSISSALYIFAMMPFAIVCLTCTKMPVVLRELYLYCTCPTLIIDTVRLCLVSYRGRTRA